MNEYSAEFQRLVFRILNRAQSEGANSNWYTEFKTVDESNAFGKCVEMGYISGFSMTKNAKGNYVGERNREQFGITDRGAQFLQSLKNQQR